MPHDDTGRREAAPIASIELLFDAAAEAAVRADWDALAAGGLSSAGSHPGPTNRPHLSLAVRTRLGNLDALAAATMPVPETVRLAGLVMFPHGDRVVLARAVVPDRELLDLHHAVADATHAWGDPLPHTGPGVWTPHVTLARRLRVDDLPRALSLVAADDIAARTAGLRVWDAAQRRVHDLG